MRVERRFPHEPASVTAARHFTADTLEDLDRDTTETVVLMVSELASNCVRHTGSGFLLAVVLNGEGVRVEVTDSGTAMPEMRSPEPTDPGGRGLRIVDTLSTSWGVIRKATAGKTVWFTVLAGVPAAISGSA